MVNRQVAATAFLTFVGLDENRRPARVPEVIPETEEERILNETAPGRAMNSKGKKRTKQSIV